MLTSPRICTAYSFAYQPVSKCNRPYGDYVRLIACMIVIGCGVYVKRVEDEHQAHAEHEKHEHGDEEKPNYLWLNKRAKPFPWGYNTLFYNPEVRHSTYKKQFVLLTRHSPHVAGEQGYDSKGRVDVQLPAPFLLYRKLTIP